MYTICQSNDSWKSGVLRSLGKIGKEAAVLTEMGSLFHALGAATGKARSPSDDRRVGGTRNVELSRGPQTAAAVTCAVRRSVKVVYQNGSAKWSSKMVHQNGPSKWSIKMVHQNGPSKWSIKMIHQNGPPKWSIKMVHQNAPPKWSIQIVQTSGTF